MDTKEAKIYIAILIAAIILAVILAYFVISIIRHHRRNLRLHKEKIQAEIVTLENERKRMASDLHDELGPVLSAVKMQINSIETNEEDEELVATASKHLDQALKRIREISNNLMPVVLVRKGFVQALQDYANNINQTGKLHINVEVEENTTNLPAEKEIHLYRISQEIIHNAIKHAQASVINISISTNQNLFILHIQDNGQGFDQIAASRNSSGHGLGNIMSRVEILQGDVYLETSSGKGVKYSIEIPV